MKNVGRSSGLEIALQLTLRGWLTPAFWMELSLIRAGTTLCILHSLLDVSGRPEPKWVPTLSEVTPLKRAKSLALVGARWLWSGAMPLGPTRSDGEQFRDFSLPGDKMT